MFWRVLGMFALAAAFWMAACDGASAPAATPTTAPPVTVTGDPSLIVLTWTRTGGIAGFCDGMTVTAGHRATLGTCEDPGAEQVRVFLSAEWIERVEEWRDRVGPFEYRHEDPPGQSDRMTVTVQFQGRRAPGASEAEQQEIASFAAELFAALQAIQPRVQVR